MPDLYDLYDMYDLHDLYNLAHVAGWEPYNLRELGHVSSRLELYCADPVQHIMTTG